MPERRALWRGPRALTLGALIVVVAACSPPAASPSAEPSVPSESAPAVVGTWPPGCESIDLRDPRDGSAVELSGAWIDESREDADAGQMTWWILTQGDCFYGTGKVDDVREEGQFKGPAVTVQMFTGTIQSDFTIEGSILHVGPRSDFAANAPSYAPVRLLIDFPDAGGLELREDRVAGEIDQVRCPDPLFCVPPMRLVPL